ncbi:MAG TPA: FAD-binding protein [Thermoanaerobaculia bacterium]|jgi:FAD/FMN-containing dehydrogenase|nr:FAD-binding protein [Thermoanaerobaculia bacterium]
MTEPDCHVYPGGRVDERDPRYSTLVRGFNLRWVGHPSYIQVCGDTKQVVRTVQDAVDRGLRITVRSGGHCYENFAVGNDGGVIVDMAPMNRVYYDDARGAYCIEAGATLWNVYWNLYKEYGRAIPGGSCYSVGAGGHITGGGYGLLSRKHGLVIDWLTAVEIVHVDEAHRAAARIVDAHGSESERDLLWANQGGGGGNFGIVTRFWFDSLPEAPPSAWIVNLAWNWDGMDQHQFTALVERYGQFFAENSQPGSAYEGLFALFHLTHKAASQIVLTAQYVGNEPRRLNEFVDFMHGDPRVTRAVAQTHAIGRHYFPLNTTEIRELPWLYATQTFDGSGANQRGKYKSAYMIKPFPQSQIDVMWKYLTDGFTNAQALLQVDSYGCEINRVASDATAIPQRSSILKPQYQTYWTTEAETEENLRWINDFYVAMYGDAGPRPDGTMDGCYVNYPDCDLKDWQFLYYLGNYPRLRKAKREWDPHDVFHHAQSIT